MRQYGILKKVISVPFLLSFAACLFFFAGSAFSAKRDAKLTEIKGTVEVQKKGAKTWVKATEGMKVGEGDAIRTKMKSSVVIKWDASTMVKLTAFTNFAITKSAVDSSSGKENTTVSLFIGKTYSKVKKALKPGSSFEVSTPTAIAGVRSTYWYTSVSGGGDTEVGFLEGSGYLSAGGKTVDVAEGEKSQAKGNQTPSEPKPMTQEEKNKAKDESKELTTTSDTGTNTEEIKLSVDTPKDGAETTDEKVKVSGSVTAGASVTVAGASVSVDASGKFTGDVSLKPGENKIAVKASNASGKTAEATVTVKFKKKEKEDAPTLTLKEPSDGAKTGSENIKVSGMAKDAKKVTVNGEEVKPESDGSFSTSVTLKTGDNTISVSASNDAGTTTLSAKVTYEPKAKAGAPTLTLTQPVNGMVSTEATVLVAGTASEATTVTINGAAANVGADGGFKGMVTLKDGDNTINVSASNDAGSVSQSVKVSYHPMASDAIPPILTVTSPVNNSITNQPSALLSGNTEDGAKVTVNGASVTVSGGAFSTPITLTEGQNTLTVVAMDAAGNKTTQSALVTLDSIPPMLTITYPSDNFVSSTPSLSLQGMTDANAKVTVGSTEVTADSGGNFTAVLVLNDGDNIINVKAVDKAGNIATASKKVTYKSAPFFLTVSQPADSSLTSQTSVQVLGFTDAAAKVTINGLSTTVFPSGSFQLDVPLATEGLNTITIQAKDSTGAILNVVKQVTRDTVPPMLTVSTPSPGFLTNNTVALVTGVVETGASVMVNGVSVTSSGSFSQSVTLTEGSNTITVAAKDKAGNVSTVNVTGTLDTLAPILTISEPPDGAQTFKPQVKLVGFTEANAVVKINGLQTTVLAGGTLDQCLNLNTGGNTFTITSTDKAGNVATVVKQVTRTDIPPLIDPVPPCQ